MGKRIKKYDGYVAEWDRDVPLLADDFLKRLELFTRHPVPESGSDAFRVGKLVDEVFLTTTSVANQREALTAINAVLMRHNQPELEEKLIEDKVEFKSKLTGSIQKAYRGKADPVAEFMNEVQSSKTELSDSNPLKRKQPPVLESFMLPSEVEKREAASMEKRLGVRMGTQSKASARLAQKAELLARKEKETDALGARIADNEAVTAAGQETTGALSDKSMQDRWKWELQRVAVRRLGEDVAREKIGLFAKQVKQYPRYDRHIDENVSKERLLSLFLNNLGMRIMLSAELLKEKSCLGKEEAKDPLLAEREQIERRHVALPHFAMEGVHYPSEVTPVAFSQALRQTVDEFISYSKKLPTNYDRRLSSEAVSQGIDLAIDTIRCVHSETSLAPSKDLSQMSKSPHIDHIAYNGNWFFKVDDEAIENLKRNFAKKIGFNDYSNGSLTLKSPGAYKANTAIGAASAVFGR